MKKTNKPKKKTSASTTKRKPAKRVSSSSSHPPRALFPYPIAEHANLEWHTRRFDALIRKFHEDVRNMLRKAYVFAAERHGEQKRRGGSPYIAHPVRVANILLGEWTQTDPDVIAASLLHDVIEDTQTTLKEVKDVFGNDVGKLVDGLTMWKGSETYEVYLRRIAKGTKDLRIMKCADALDNLRSWHECPAEDRAHLQRWWKQAHEFVLPMAEETSRQAEKQLRAVLDNAWYLTKAHIQ